MTTNYRNTFIHVADDCPASKGEVPPVKEIKKTIATLQYEIIYSNPYRFTSDDVLFEAYAIKNELTEEEKHKAREQYFSKGQPCLRACPLTKRYGWGVHSDEGGRVAIYGMETEKYKTLLQDKTLVQLKAMRSSKK